MITNAGNSWVSIGLAGLLILCLVPYGDLVAQTTPASSKHPVKLDEYGDLPTDDEAAHLDLFAEKLFKQPDLRGYLLAKAELDWNVVITCE